MFLSIYKFSDQISLDIHCRVLWYRQKNSLLIFFFPSYVQISLLIFLASYDNADFHFHFSSAHFVPSNLWVFRNLREKDHVESCGLLLIASTSFRIHPFPLRIQYNPKIRWETLTIEVISSEEERQMCLQSHNSPMCYSILDGEDITRTRRERESERREIVRWCTHVGCSFVF